MNNSNIEIIERIKSVTGCENDFQISKALGIGPSTIANWRALKKPPYEGCFLTAIKTGCDPIWLITGEEHTEIETGNEIKEIDDYNRFQKSLKNGLSLCITLGYINASKEIDNAENILSRICYSEYKGIDLKDKDNIINKAENKKKA